MAITTTSFNTFSGNRECQIFFRKSEVTGQLALVSSNPQSFVHRNQTSLLANDCLIIIYRYR